MTPQSKGRLSQRITGSGTLGEVAYSTRLGNPKPNADSGLWLAATNSQQAAWNATARKRELQGESSGVGKPKRPAGRGFRWLGGLRKSGTGGYESDEDFRELESSLNSTESCPAPGRRVARRC